MDCSQLHLNFDLHFVIASNFPRSANALQPLKQEPRAIKVSVEEIGSMLCMFSLQMVTGHCWKGQQPVRFEEVEVWNFREADQINWNLIVSGFEYSHFIAFS